MRKIQPEDRQKAFSVKELQNWLQEKLGKILEVKPAEIDISQPFNEYGLSSTEAVSLSGELAELLGCELPPTLVYDYPTITRLTQHLVDRDASYEYTTEARITGEPSPTSVPIEEDAIAIIGMACRFPGGANTPDAFWQLLSQGKSATTEVPSQRWNIDDYYDPSPEASGKMYTRYGCFLENIELFDASFFGFSPREAIRMDPQHRLLAEVAWEAMEHAALAVDSLAGSQTGVFIGMMNNYEYTQLQMHQGDGSWIDDPYFGTGSASSMVSGRLAYLFDFRGPTLTVDTACSSSLVSLHLACQSLRNNECTLALVGGANTLLSPENVVTACKMGMLSADGRCKTFDESADGFVLGEGCGVVVLKPLSQALADGNTVLAIVRGSAVNQDGQSNGITAPNKLAQEAVIRKALACAGVTPERVSYVEAHGSGTVLGDPIEIGALEAVLGVDRSPQQPLLVGAVKTNIGHLAGASGIAGLIKTVLALKHREIPPHLNLQRLNPHISQLQARIAIPTELMPWDEEEQTRIAGVSSFGWSGTNAHVVLEEAPLPESSTASRSKQLLVLSARTDAALETMITNLRTHLQNSPELALADLAFTLQAGRKAFSHRYTQVCSTVAEAIDQLESRQGLTAIAASRARPLVFLFPGQGTQYVHMGAGLYSEEVAFRAEVDRCAELLMPYLKLDVREILYPAEAGIVAAQQQLNQASIAEPALFVIEYALAKQWMKWGIYPQSMLGVGVGEYVAACLAEVLSLEDALMLVAARGHLIQELPDGALLSATEKEFQALEQFTALVQSISLHAPKIPYLSHLTGSWITEQEVTDPRYWTRHLRQIARCAEGLGALLTNPDGILLEVGPASSLTTLVQQHPEKKPGQIMLSSLRHPQDLTTDSTFLLDTCGKLWGAGASIKWSAFYTNERRHRLSLPTYPFERKRYWINLPVPEASLSKKKRQPSLIKIEKKADVADWFYRVNWQQMPLQVLSEQARFALQSWLIFTDDRGPGEQIADHLESEGHNVIRVRAGERFVQIDARIFSLRPGQSDDYKMLCKMVTATGQMPEITLHCWNVAPETGKTTSSEYFLEQQEKGFYSLLYFVQALGMETPDNPHRLVVLSSQAQCVTGQEALQPEKAPILSICRVIPQEYSHIACCSLDLDIPGGGTWQDAIEIKQIVEECSRALSDPSIAYRGRIRLVQTYQPWRLEAALPPLRQHGVYLITGGSGNIALLLAEYLAQTVQARLILVGRSVLPPRSSWDTYAESLHPDSTVLHRIRRIQRIEAQGAEVSIIQADVANESQMRATIDQTYERFGCLNGVIHAAGIVTKEAFKTIQATDHAECEMHFRPKVYGTLALERVLQDRDLDFCLLFSSLSVVLGGLAFAAYSASNAFMDMFAYRHNQTSTIPWLSVNWDGWPINEDIHSMSGGTPNALVMTEQESWDAFTRVLTGRQTHLVHSTGDLFARMEQWLRSEPAQKNILSPQDKAGASATRVTSAQEFSRTDYEQKITEIWQQVLGIEEMRLDDNFFDLGGNSLLTLEVTARLKKAFHKPIPAVALFEAPTISALVNYLRPQAVMDRPEIVAPESYSDTHKADVAQESIAIIGMTGRFPGAATVDEFWQNLRNGREAITFFSEQELLEVGVSPAQLRAPNYIRARPILEGIDLFDAPFFDYSPREAELMDPQHRLFLECSWEALEHAGYDPSTYDGAIGVYAGANLSTYLLTLMTNPEAMGPVNDYQVVIGNDKDSLTTTVSYKLNLRGPSFAVQTFCSTSLVAIHLACQSLRRGECHMALAGGVSVRVPGKAGYLYEEGGMESPDGHCRTFDAQARGTLFGDGVGVVVLKSLSQALADGDTIHAVIKGSAINNDGSLKVSYTAPSVVGQAEVIASALKDARVEAESISYIEAHGTATTLGDPIEVAALTKAFRTQTDKRGYCAIGSAKTNIGHTDRAAGVAGLIKTVLALKEKEIPANLHYQSPNPEINFAESPFYVNAQLAEWVSTGGPRRAGVSSLGMGGTNAHLVVEEAPELPASGPSRPWQLLVLSARTPAAMEIASKNLREYLQSHKDVPLADIARTLQMGRKRFEHRRLLLCRNHEEAIRFLEKSEAPFVFDRSGHHTHRPVAFLFPDAGKQYAGLARGLYQQETIFRETVDRCCELLQAVLHIDLHQILFTDTLSSTTETNMFDFSVPQRENGGDRQQGISQADELDQPAITQPLAFVVEYALAQLLIHWGIYPQAMLGYSLGEYVAACLAGIFSLEGALTLVAQRARLIQELPRSIQLNPPRIPCLSNVTGTWITDEQATDPTYWAQHMCRTVRFTDGVTHLLQDTELVLLEVGPGQALSSLIRQHPLCESERMALVLTTCPSPMERRSKYEHLLLTLGKLWLTGVSINWQGFYTHERRRRVPLPPYPFERQRYWIEPRRQQVSAASGDTEVAMRASKKEELSRWFYLPGWKQAAPPRSVQLSAQEDQCWLFFADASNMSAPLIDHLKQQQKSIVTVVQGASFRKYNEMTYAVRPGELTDYEALLRELQGSGKLPHRVVHLWTVTSDEEQGAYDAQAVLEAGFYSILALTQALQNAGLQTCSLSLISSRMQNVIGNEPVCPEKAALMGPCRVIPQECPTFRCQSIDIIAPLPGTQMENVLVKQLVAELTSEFVDTVVALRGNRRWVQTFEPVELDGKTSDTSPLRDGGVYLITGGLGGIGLAIGEHLVRTIGARLVLVGRTGLPPRHTWDQILAQADNVTRGQARVIHILQTLEAQGAQILTLQADVRSKEQMRSVIAQAQERFGGLHGVFHTAGVPGAGLIQFKIMEQAREVLGPKVDGTLVLEEVLADTEVELVVLFSSVTAWTGGGPGQIDYSAANAFLGAYAQSQSGKGRQVVTIDWNEWQWNAWEAGLAGFDSEIQSILQEDRRRYGITFAEGIEALERVLATGLPQVIVSSHDFLALVEESKRLTATYILQQKHTLRSVQETHLRPELAESYMPARNEIEQRIVTLWETLLGIAPVGINDNFFELGGNSLTGIDLIARLRKMFQLETLAAHVLYEAPTVSTLALYIGNGKSDQEEVKERLERGEKRRASQKRSVHESKKIRRQVQEVEYSLEAGQ
jgi:acyl transferase domain-containing protein/acyl carrier protein